MFCLCALKNPAQWLGFILLSHFLCLLNHFLRRFLRRLLCSSSNNVSFTLEPYIFFIHFTTASLIYLPAGNKNKFHNPDKNDEITLYSQEKVAEIKPKILVRSFAHAAFQIVINQDQKFFQYVFNVFIILLSLLVMLPFRLLAIKYI